MAWKISSNTRTVTKYLGPMSSVQFFSQSYWNALGRQQSVLHASSIWHLIVIEVQHKQNEYEVDKY
eukprot:1746615-Amphidinium_carterae.1